MFELLSEYKTIILGTIVLLVGIIDEFKWYLQYSKIKLTKRIGGVSRRVLLISVFSKSVVFSYAIYTRNMVFASLYLVGIVTSFMALRIIYRYSQMKDKNIINFILKSLHIKIVKIKKEK